MKSWTTKLITHTLPFLLVCSCNFVSMPPAPLPSQDLIQRNTVSHYTPKRPPEVPVWIVADSLHTGMVFPYEWLIESGFNPPQNFPKCRYVSLSWGDRNAYINKRWLTPTEIIQAIFLPSPSVMECIPVNWEVPEVTPNQHIWMKSIPRERGPYVASFLNSCTVLDKKGKPIIVAPSSWGNGFLLQSPQAYYFPRICNVWTGHAMQACGVNIPPLLAVHRDTLVTVAEANGFSHIWDGSGNKNQ